MEFFSFRLMPWPYLPDDYTGSAWITVPCPALQSGSSHLIRGCDQAVAGCGWFGVAVRSQIRRVRREAA